MFEHILNFFKKIGKNDNKETNGSKNRAKERLHLVLMQDRANVSADFLELMKQEIIEVIKKYIEVEESEIDVRLTNEVKDDGTTGAPSLYANIPIVNIKDDMKKNDSNDENSKNKEKKSEEMQEMKEENHTKNQVEDEPIDKEAEKVEVQNETEGEENKESSEKKDEQD